MKFIYLLIFILICQACGGQLNEKQRKELREEEANHEIKRVTDQQIMTRAMETGRKVRAALEKGVNRDTLTTEYNVKISEYHGQKPLTGITQRIWEAYQGAAPADLADNLQRDYPEQLIYTYPIIQQDTLAGMKIILISKKAIVLSF